jgi:hypothetical protein
MSRAGRGSDAVGDATLARKGVAGPASWAGSAHDALGRVGIANIRCFTGRGQKTWSPALPSRRRGAHVSGLETFFSGFVLVTLPRGVVTAPSLGDRRLSQTACVASPVADGFRFGRRVLLLVFARVSGGEHD